MGLRNKLPSRVHERSVEITTELLTGAVVTMHMYYTFSVCLETHVTSANALAYFRQLTALTDSLIQIQHSEFGKHGFTHFRLHFHSKLEDRGGRPFACSTGVL